MRQGEGNIPWFLSILPKTQWLLSRNFWDVLHWTSRGLSAPSASWRVLPGKSASHCMSGFPLHATAEKCHFSKTPPKETCCCKDHFKCTLPISCHSTARCRWSFTAEVIWWDVCRERGERSCSSKDGALPKILEHNNNAALWPSCETNVSWLWSTHSLQLPQVPNSTFHLFVCVQKQSLMSLFSFLELSLIVSYFFSHFLLLFHLVFVYAVQAPLQVTIF